VPPSPYSLNSPPSLLHLPEDIGLWDFTIYTDSKASNYELMDVDEEEGKGDQVSRFASLL
jgi:hypothetical protein